MATRTVGRVNLDLDLPDPFPSFGTYVMAVVDGDMLYTAGHVPFDGTALITGKLGGQLTVEQGCDAARIAALTAAPPPARGPPSLPAIR